MTDVSAPGRSLVARARAIAAGAAVLLGMVACGSPDAETPAVPPGPTMLPAPYLKPIVGTRLVYDAFANVIVRADSWRVEFRDERGEMGARVGGFIPDNPKIPLALDAGLFAKLWPLRIGNALDIEAQRYPLIWRWHIAVIGTAHVVTQAGPFDCFLVEAVETPVVSTSNRPYTDVTRYWYAPSIGQVVRIDAERVGGPGAGAHRTAELVRVDAPGRASGAAPPARSGGR